VSCRPRSGGRRLGCVQIYRLGDEGPEIRDIQQRLNGLGETIDPAERGGRFGTSTAAAVQAFQRRRHLPVDGLVGPDTWGQLVEAGYQLGDRTLYLHAPNFRGDDVRALQRKLNALGFDAGKQDGLFGPATEGAVREFQRNVGDEPDGIVGPHGVEVLERMRPQEAGPGRALIREEEQLRGTRPPLEGAVVAIDLEPAGDPSALAIAETLRDRLAALGAKPAIVGAAGDDPSPSARARSANELGAAACVSVQVAAQPEPVCSYFGSPTTHSPAGMLLARLILDELERELGSTGRVRRLTVAVLRETRMPSVIVEIPLAPVEPPETSGVGDAVARGLRAFFSG